MLIINVCLLLVLTVVLLLSWNLFQQPKESFMVLTEQDINLGSFLQVEKNIPTDTKQMTFVNLDVEASDNLFARTVQTKPIHPTPEQMTQTFRDCLKKGQDTIKGCLTLARVGLEPYMCKKLASEYYGEINNYTGLLCNQLMNQQRTSCSAGPC